MSVLLLIVRGVWGGGGGPRTNVQCGLCVVTWVGLVLRMFGLDL